MVEAHIEDFFNQRGEDYGQIWLLFSINKNVFNHRLGLLFRTGAREPTPWFQESLVNQ